MDLQFPRRFRPLVLSFGLSVFGAGCMTGPDHCEPVPVLPDVWHQELVDDGQYVERLHNWWDTFDDPVLNAMIEHASTNNRDLYAAVTRVRQAAARQRIAGSPKYPFVDAVGSRSNFELSETTPTYLNPRDLSPFAPHDFSKSLQKWESGFNLSWEPDVWGRIARQIEAAEAGTCASVENYRDVLVSLHAQVAQSYVLLRQLQAQKKFAVENAELQEQSLQLAKDRLDAGLVPELDVHQAQLNRSRTSASVPRLEAAIQEQLALLAMLLGETSGEINVLLENPMDIPVARRPADVIIPCNLIRRRPDIRGAERQLAAATAQVGVAETDLLPRFFVGGEFGLESENFSDLFDNDSFTFGVGPSFKWAIFRAGQIRNNIDLKEAGVEEAVARYEQSVLNAFREVETALSAYQQEKKRRDELAVATDAAAKAVENVSALYRAGKTDFQNVLVTQESLAQMQNQLADSEGRVAINLVILYKAMGGGWNCNDHTRHHSCRIGAKFRAVPFDAVPLDNGVLDLQPHSAPTEAPEGSPVPTPLEFEGTSLPPEPQASRSASPVKGSKLGRIRSSLKKVSDAFPGVSLRRKAEVSQSTTKVERRAPIVPVQQVSSDVIVAPSGERSQPPVFDLGESVKPQVINLHGR